ncbi:tail fiber domain-containing protein [Glutamicibacter nicotianae]|uniref:tail fiber domain-containing protein n=1 Tax=Glutamicibacter nicotianae TaxID=37929 RepID=UPI001CBDB899|nr:tail fiber domain-containing protein [Glutamicibacter nicotianae]
MARRFDLTGENITRRNAQRDTYGNQTPLSSTAVERGSTRWLSGSYVQIDGLLDVNGTATVGGVLSVTGTLNASGQINLSGSTAITGPLNVTGTTTIGGNTNITGELNVTGPTTLDGITDIGGDTTITGLLDITGNTTVDGNFEILGNGLFKAGVTQIEPTGKATFGDFIIDPNSNKLIQAPGGWLFSTGPGSIGLADSGTSSVNLNSTRAELVYGNNSRLVADSTGVKLTGALTDVSGNLTVAGVATVKGSTDLQGWLKATALPSSTDASNLVRASNGWVYVSSSARRFKNDIQPVELPDSLLNIGMSDWVDKGEADRGEPYRRITGVIAEEVAKAGGEPFVTWDAEGQIQGVNYDRLALAITQILKNQVADLQERVAQLESVG